MHCFNTNEVEFSHKNENTYLFLQGKFTIIEMYVRKQEILANAMNVYRSFIRSGSEGFLIAPEPESEFVLLEQEWSRSRKKK